MAFEIHKITFSGEATITLPPELFDLFITAIYNPERLDITIPVSATDIAKRIINGEEADYHTVTISLGLQK